MSQKPYNLLIVEDDQNLANHLRTVAPDSFQTFLCKHPDLLPEHIHFHAALVDMHIAVTPPTPADGPSVIERLMKRNPQMEVVAMSGDLDRQLMEKAIRAGASRFLGKPLISEEILSVLSKIEAYLNLIQISQDAHVRKFQLVGTSEKTNELKKQIALLKGETTPVLIEGETGTGKEVVASLLHQQESKRPFITVNCSALPENLFESEFYGHIKGAFTGADTNKIGLAEAAHGGDLFLDEIEALPITQQAKLLRFLESGEIRRVGAKDSIRVDVRIIAASNISLAQLIEEKKFREDLFFRLSSNRIQLPALRDRPDDVFSLAEFFILSARPKKNKVMDEACRPLLQDYAWPGNVRELKRICEQVLLTSQRPIILPEDFSRLLQPNETKNSQVPALSLEDYLNQQEKFFIETSLKKLKDVEKVSLELKISKSNLYKKIKDLGIQHE